MGMPRIEVKHFSFNLTSLSLYLLTVGLSEPGDREGAAGLLLLVGRGEAGADACHARRRRRHEPVDEGVLAQDLLLQQG